METFQRRFLLTTCVALSLAATFAILRQTILNRPTPPHPLYHCLGERLAAEALKLAGNSGPVVAFMADPPDQLHPVDAAILHGFRTAIQKVPGITLHIEHPANPTVAPQILESQGLPASVAADLLAKRASAKVVVSFCGPPRAELPQTSPAIIALSETDPASVEGELFVASALQVIIYRKTHPPPRPLPTACEQLFDAHYTVVTRDHDRR